MKANHLLNHPVVGKMVYDKYPVSKAEKKCPIEKADMDRLRIGMAKKLYEELPKEKMEYGK